MKINWWPAAVAGIVSLLILGTFAADNLTAFAQAGKTLPAPKAAPKPQTPGAKKAKGKSGNALLKRLLAQLNLTPDQTTKLQTLEAGNKKTVDGIKANKTLTVDQKKLLVRAEGKNLRDKAALILTPAQKEKLKTLMLQATLARKAKSGKGVAQAMPGKPATK